MKKLPALLAVLLLSTFSLVAHAATDWSTQDYGLYPGDFNGDGKTDLLYVAKDPTKPSGITLSDGSGPNLPYQSWPSNYLGIPWDNNTYRAIVADFNGDGRADVFMQRNSPGNSFLLLANAEGKLVAINQTIPNSFLGYVWTADQHNIVAGDFNGDGRTDLFLQAATSTTSILNAIFYADTNGTFNSNATQSWNEGYLGLKWAATNAVVHAGDFNGDGKKDLLVQARPRFEIVSVNATTPTPSYVSAPVPTYPPNLNAVLYSQGGTNPIQGLANMSPFSRNAYGADFSPLISTAVIGDFNGDGRADVLLQSRSSSRSSFLLNGNASGAPFATAAALANNVSIAADTYRALTGNFDGTGGAGIYLQSVSPAGTNAYTNTITGASLSLTTHDTTMSAGVVPANTVGVTSARFAVGNDGAANYSIPIVVPPGIAGIQPQLALSYSSRRGNGWVGVGWDLSGLSEIGRCARTVAQDGAAGNVSLTSADRFCLDGSRLRLTGGTYGAANSTYQTELETFSRVTAYSSSGNGPGYFIVESKNGLKYEYGNTSDSRIESLGSSTPRVWALNKVSDRSGNVMTLSYGEDPINGTFHPEEIVYTANTAAGVNPAYKVKFYWETRPNSDPLTGYFAGSIIREVARLNRIETLFNDTGGFRTVRRYQLSYSANNSTWRSRLGAVQECDGSGNCLSPTNIAWQDGQAGLNAAVNTGSGGSLANFMLPIDMNGDGRADRVYPGASGTWQFMLADTSPSGFGAAQNSGIDNGKYEFSVAIDYDSDGKIDILTTNSAGNGRILRSTGTGFTVIELGFFTGATTGSTDYTVADVNGDGRADYVEGSVGASELFGRFNSVSGFGAASVTYTNSSTTGNTSALFNRYYRVPSAPGAGLILGDFDADGRTEVIASVGNGSATNSMLFGSSAFPPLLGRLINVASTRVADFNGDGIDDVAHTCGAVWCLRFGSGQSLGPEINTGQFANASGLIVAMDWDNDAKADLLQGDGSGNFQLLRSRGESFAAPVDTGISSAGVVSPKAVDVNGDGLADLSYTDSSGNFWVRTHRGTIPDLLTSVTDGFGNATTVAYLPLTDASVYAKSSGAIFPQIDVQSAQYVVKQYSQTDGTGGSFSVDAVYAGARTDLSGRGSLGFASRRLKDSRNNIFVYDYFRQDFPFVGQVSQHDERQSDNVTLIQRVTNSYASTVIDGTPNNQRHLVTQTQAVTKRYEIGGTKNGVQIVEQTTSFTAYDAFGNATDVTTSITDKDSASLFFNQTWQARTVNTIANYPSTWCLGKPTKIALTSTLPDNTSQTRTIGYSIDSTACRVTQEVVEPESTNPNLRITTNYTYNTTPASCGNLESVSVIGKNFDGTDMQARTTTFDYGTRCIAVEKVTNPLGHIVTMGYRYDLGVPTSVRDPNQLTTDTTYDGFGRTRRVQRPDGTATEQSYASCTAANTYCGMPDLRFQVQTVERDASNAVISTEVTSLDGYGRGRVTQAQRSTGALSYVQRTYDSLGRLATVSRPYSSSSNGVTRQTYDVINRLTRTELVRADGSVDRTTTTDYAGGTLLVKDAKLNTVQRVFDPAGLLRRTTDALGSTTQYTYDHFLNLKRVVDPSGNTTNVAFNVRGFKTSTSDPDMGNWTYEHDSFGELTSQRDAKNQVVTFTYDRLGRVVSRVEPEGTSTFTYDAATKGIGRLASLSSPGGYAEVYTYDTFGRDQRVTYTQDTTYQVDYDYNNQGLLDAVTYPTSTSNYRLKLKYAYAFGQLTQVMDFNAPSTVFWALNATDDADNPIDETLGNGVRLISGYDPLTGELNSREGGNGGSTTNLQNLTYQWGKTGKLEQRQDTLQNLRETFSYDNLDRLTSSTLFTSSTPSGTTNLSVMYNALGNITSKSDVGAYNYTTTQAGCSYYTHTQPHAVRSSGSNIYCYDQNGNMTRRAGSDITWTSYNLPSQITSGTNSSQFSYGADRQRWRQVATYGGTTETTIYVAGIMNKVTRNGVTEYRHYITGGSDATAIYTRRSNGTTDTVYTTTDHLGSADVITDSSGAVRLRESFTAFGARRGSNWTGAPATADLNQITATTRDGYTGHEHLDNLDLIHMNGRVYDPKLARFISADPFVQAPDDLQSLNRYSYVSNSPLSFTDPSGFAQVCISPAGFAAVTCFDVPTPAPDFPLPCFTCSRPNLPPGPPGPGLPPGFNPMIPGGEATPAEETDTGAMSDENFFEADRSGSSPIETVTVVTQYERAFDALDGFESRQTLAAAGPAAAAAAAYIAIRLGVRAGQRYVKRALLDQAKARLRYAAQVKEVEDAIARVEAKGLANLDRFVSEDEVQNAFGKFFPLVLGTAVHEAVADELGKGWDYNRTRSYDYRQRRTGAKIELTTNNPATELFHILRNPKIPVVTYDPANFR